MTVDLSRNNTTLKEAWKDVLSDKSDTNWALFGYEGQTNVLKFVSKGSDGVNELKEDLNSGKIMYAFIKLNDPSTSLNKCVLINWQGEGANTVRKGMCANHLRDIEKFFTGAHLTYNARNEDEVDEDLLIEKLKKVGSEYKFKLKVEPVEPATPVGTRYQKVNAVKEINSQERDKFWKKEEQEEKKRIEEERRRKEEELKLLEVQRQQREEKEAQKREQQAETHNQQAEQTRKNEQSNFTQETEKHNVAPEKPVRASILRNQIQNNGELNVNRNLLSPEPTNNESTISDDEGDQFATIKRSPKDASNPAKTVETPTSPAQDEKANSSPFVEQTVQMLEQDFVDEYIYGIGKEGYKAKALYDYQAADDTEISFDPGDVITNIEKVDEGWWQGLAPDGITYGLFPANYVELIE